MCKYVFIIFLLVASTSVAKLPNVEKGQPLPSDLFVELAKLVNPTVVNISTTQLRKGPQLNRMDPYSMFLEEFFGPQAFEQMQQKPAQSLGTGFIIRKDGLIITNNHVIDKADTIKVQLSEKDDKLYEAKIIGKDARTDIALIKIKVDSDLPTVKLGSSSALEVGEWVSAFGNPYGHGHTMTKGIVSAKGREISEINKFSFIQTDASINPGNSGGPLVNVKGEVVGVNTAIDARAQGIGFAIPIDDIKKILPELESNGHVKRGYLGVNIKGVTPQVIQALNLKSKEGALIVQVLENSPATKAGLKPYDVVVEINKKPVTDPSELIRIVSDSTVNQAYDFKIEREGEFKNIKVTIKERPDDKLAKNPTNRFKGRKAPFKLGFELMNYSRKIAKEWGLPLLKKPHPIIIEVKQNTPAHFAGLSAGDIILDVNRQSTKNTEDVFKRLRKNRVNFMRILRGNTAVLVQLKAR